MTTPPTADDRLDELTSRVHALETWRAHHTDLLDELLNGTPTSGPEPSTVDSSDHDLDIAALIPWVHDVVTSMIARPLRGESVWCPLWWEHPEAIFRFEALRRAWAELAPEPGAAMSVWIRDHLDPCLRELLSPTGPFADCRPSERSRGTAGHNPVPTLPTRSPAGTS